LLLRRRNRCARLAWLSGSRAELAQSAWPRANGGGIVGQTWWAAGSGGAKEKGLGVKKMGGFVRAKLFYERVPEGIVCF
jgi:hypothetical protein